VSDDSSNVGLLGDRTKIRDIRDLEDGNAVDQVLLVRDSELRQTPTGANFMRLALADRTGVITGLVWDDVQNASATARPGDPGQGRRQVLGAPTLRLPADCRGLRHPARG
jgi:hypothetical protein